MRVIDASSALFAWDTYPPDQFPRLWDWLALQIESGDLTTAQVALMEIGHITPECARWLKARRIVEHPTGQAVADEGARIKALLGIVDDDFGTGVDANDLLIVATARLLRASLISDEAPQLVLPNSMRKYKIPAVTRMPLVQVDCRNFVDYVKQSRAVFG